MEYTEVEVLLDRQMPHTGDKRLPERPILRPFCKSAVDVGVMLGRLAMGVSGDGEALPLHAGIQDP
jgi:hypothetical protein